jgi:hypothetical protein
VSPPFTSSASPIANSTWPTAPDHAAPGHKSLIADAGLSRQPTGERRTSSDQKNAGNHQRSDGREIGNGDAVGGSKYEQHGSLNRTVDKDPTHGCCGQTNRQPSATSFGGVGEYARHRARIDGRDLSDDEVRQCAEAV